MGFTEKVEEGSGPGHAILSPQPSPLGTFHHAQKGRVASWAGGPQILAGTPLGHGFSMQVQQTSCHAVRLARAVG